MSTRAPLTTLLADFLRRREADHPPRFLTPAPSEPPPVRNPIPVQSRPRGAR